MGIESEQGSLAGQDGQQVYEQERTADTGNSDRAKNGVALARLTIDRMSSGSSRKFNERIMKLAEWGVGVVQMKPGKYLLLQIQGIIKPAARRQYPWFKGDDRNTGTGVCREAYFASALQLGPEQCLDRSQRAWRDHS